MRRKYFTNKILVKCIAKDGDDIFLDHFLVLLKGKIGYKVGMKNKKWGKWETNVS